MNLRVVDKKIGNHFEGGNQVLVLLGARQVGKTTLVKRVFPDALYLTVDNEVTRQNLNKYDISVYSQILGQSKFLIVDEAQRLDDPGRMAKIIHDQLPEVRLVVTGSSSFRLKNKTSESLAGRKIEYHLFPLTINEYLFQKKYTDSLDDTRSIYNFDFDSITRHLMVYGLYPAILNSGQDKVYLENLIDSVIFKDLVDLSLIENRPAAISILKLLAFQVGQLVNYSDLANRSGVDVKTVRRYLKLFEESYIIFTLLPYRTNKRDEIGKSPKIYFFDNGVRNALISDFRPIEDRTDTGPLMENLVISELYKQNEYGGQGYLFNYWRTKQGSEIDLVLSRPGKLMGIEIKSSDRRVNRSFSTRYPDSIFKVVNRQNLATRNWFLD